MQVNTAKRAESYKKDGQAAESFAVSPGILPGSAAVRSEPVTYKDGDTVLEGYLAWNEAVKGKRPGVLVVHEWWGRNACVERRARQLAELGYVALAADMYGKGVVTDNAGRAGELSGQSKKDLALGRTRIAKAFELFR